MASEEDLRAILSGFDRDDARMARSDGWYNPVTGAGVSGLDKAASTTFGAGCILSDVKLAAMYSFEDLSARIVDVYPREALREGFELGGLDENEEEVCDYLAPFEVASVSAEGWIWGRCFGGAATWIGTNDPDPSQPLGQSYRVEFLQTIDRRWLQPARWDAIGRVEVFNVCRPGQGRQLRVIGQIHASRLVIWPGARTEELAKVNLLGWDYSVLQRPYEALRQEGSLWTNIGALVEEASVSVFKLKGLFALVGSGESNASLTRYGVINRVKSIYRAIVLDKDQEEFEQKTSQTFGGLADLSDRAIKRVAAAAEIPVTVLMGEAPAGLNATGDSDLRWFLARIVSERRLIAEPRMRRLISILLGASDSPIRDYKVQLVWPELWRPTAKEASEIYAANMTADAQGIDRQIFTPDEVFRARAGRDGWACELTFSEDARKLRNEELAKGYDPESGDTAEGEAQPPATAQDPGAAAPMSDAQVRSLVDVVSKVAAGDLPEDSAQAIIEIAFGLSAEDAKAVIGSAGEEPDEPQETPTNAPPIPPRSGANLPPTGQEPPKPGDGEGTPPARDSGGG